MAQCPVLLSKCICLNVETLVFLILSINHICATVKPSGVLMYTGCVFTSVISSVNNQGLVQV